MAQQTSLVTSPSRRRFFLESKGTASMHTSRIVFIMTMAISSCGTPNEPGADVDGVDEIEYTTPEEMVFEDYAVEQQDEDRGLKPDKQPCQGSETGPDLRQFRATELTRRVEAMHDGWVGLVVSTDSGGEALVGCMSAATAKISLDAGLSFAEIGPTRDGIRVVIATPADSTLRELPWMEPVGNEFHSSATGFIVRTFWVSDDARPTASDYSTPTEEQLLRLIDDARDGVGSVAGLAPDLLVSRDGDHSVRRPGD